MLGAALEVQNFADGEIAADIAGRHPALVRRQVRVRDPANHIRREDPDG